MIAPPHSIRSERLDIQVASEAVALALQSRLGDFNRARLVPVIERVLGEFDVPGRHIRIDRLVVDLGVLPLAGLEDAAEYALVEALRQSLRDAIGDQEAAHHASGDGEPAAGGPVEVLDHYLQFGTLPFWASSAGMPAEGFSADGLVQTLAESDPAALAALIRRRGRDPHVLERLVRQLGEAALQTLLRLIEPAHAALIVAYMLDLRQIHRTEPVVALDEASFRRMLWRLALVYLLRDAGSQFNRKSFVRSLLEDIAQDEGLDYGALVATLAEGLRATLRHASLASSLPAVIGEIVLDLGGGETPAEPEPADLADTPTSSDPAALVRLIRRYVSDRNALDRLVGRLDEATLQAVLRQLEPMHAALVIAYLADLHRIHRVKPLLTLGEAAFARLLWILTFSYLARERGSQFNRKSFVRTLLEDMAQGAGLDYGALVATLADGLRATQTHHPHASSLPAVIGEIVRDLGGSAGTEDFAPDDPDHAPAHGPADAVAANDPVALAALIRRLGGDRHRIERVVARLDDIALRAVLRLLEPVHAALMVAYLIDLREVHRNAPLSALGADAFWRMLWTLTLSYLARDAGSQFNRRSFVRGLLTDLAQTEMLNYGVLLRELAGGLRVTAGHLPVVSSLPAVIEELALERGQESAPEPSRLPPFADGAAPVIERYVRLDALAHYLRHGALPVDVLLHRPDLSVDALLAGLPSLGVMQLRALFAAPSPEARWPLLLRAVRALRPDALAQLVARLLPPEMAPDSPLRGALADAIAAAPHGDVFHAHLIAALLDGEAIDLDAMMAAAPSSLGLEGSDDSATWPVPRRVAALVTAWRGKDPSGETTDWTHLFDDVLAHHPADARALLQAVAGSPDRDAMLARLPPPLFGRVLVLLRPTEAPALAFLLDAIGEWPVSERPGSDAGLRGAVLGEALRLVSAAGAVVMAGVVGKIFGGMPPSATALRLLEAAERKGLPEAQRALLTEALSGAGDKASRREIEPPLPALRDALFGWLGAADAASNELSPEVLSALADIAAAFADEVRVFLARHMAQPELRARWSRLLPEAALARLVHAFEPQQFRALVDDAELLHAAIADVAAARQETRPPRAAMWNRLLAYLADTSAAERSTEGFVDYVLAQSAPDHDAVRQMARDLAQSVGRPRLVAALRRDRRPQPSSRRVAPAAETRERSDRRRSRGKTAFGMDEPREEARAPIYIDNAGLVLAGPFLPHLFGTLDMLARDETSRLRLRDHDTASRAAHLLQYLVDGSCSRPEPLLVLNKIMCGVASGMPIAREIEPTDRELDLCDALLKAMIAQWSGIQNSSVAALRETFLQHKGRLVHKGEGWELRVERKTVDVLVDQVPWGFSVIYNGWMPHPLHVTW